jgi:hypothetical protein
VLLTIYPIPITVAAAASQYYLAPVSLPSSLLPLSPHPSAAVTQW